MSDSDDVEPLWLSQFQEDHLEQYVWHFDMLHHPSRTAAFERAFARLPPAAVSGVALDIGTGSGLLGLMLLKHRPGGRVVGIEADKKLVGVARENVAVAGHSELMSVIHTHSTRLSSLAQSAKHCALDADGAPPTADRASLVVCEILDSPLLGEGVLPTLRHAARKLLDVGYWAVPCGAQVLATVVESDILRGMQCVLEANAKSATPKDWLGNSVDGRPHEVNLRQLLRCGRARELTDEFVALEIDFESLPPVQGQHAALDVVIKSAGNVDAIVFWWRCAMIRGDSHTHGGLTNAPGEDTDHWRQAVCVLPRPQDGRQVACGDVLSIAVSQNDDLIWFTAERAQGDTQTSPRPQKPRPTPRPCSSLSLLSPLRICMLNDTEREAQLRKVVADCMRHLRAGRFGLRKKVLSGIQIADLSEGGRLAGLCIECLCPRTQSGCALASRKRRRLLVASQQHSRSRLSSRVCHVVAAGGEAEVSREVVGAVRRSLKHCQRRRHDVPRVSFEDDDWAPDPESIDALLAEPYQSSVDERECDLQFWQHWAEVDRLRAALKSDCVIWPRRFQVHVALLSCESLWRRRVPLSGRKVGGVDVSKMDRLASGRFFPWAEGCVRRRFPSELWQQAHAVITGGSVLCDVDVLEPLESRMFPSVRLPVPSGVSGVHGLVTWTEYLVHPHEEATLGENAWLQTVCWEEGSLESRLAPSPYKQGVVLASHPWFGSTWEAGGRQTTKRARRTDPAPAPKWVDVQATFDPARGELRLCPAAWDDGRPF